MLQRPQAIDLKTVKDMFVEVRKAGHTLTKKPKWEGTNGVWITIYHVASV